MKINSKDFRVPPGKRVELSEWPTVVKPICKSKEQYQELLEKHVEELSSLQQLHYASHRYALLLIFQGMDSAGKDGATCDALQTAQEFDKSARITRDYEERLYAHYGRAPYWLQHGHGEPVLRSSWSRALDKTIGQFGRSAEVSCFPYLTASFSHQIWSKRLSL
jgi:hypothetical protein